ncbi:putative transcription factor C2H2 family [Helianthus anomalus]
MPPLSWRHHTLIQAVLSRGPLKEKDFHSIFSDVTGKTLDSHKRLFNEYLKEINRELAYVQFELRACRNQYDGFVYYGVINTVADEQSKLGTKYSVPQIAFYKGIIEAIVQDTTARGTISNIEALNIRLENQVGSSEIPPALKNFTMSQKEKAIHEFIQDQWLCATSDGNIGLGVRSFLDLRSWFHNNEVPKCDVCNEAGIKADLCPNENCTVRIHEYCLKAKFSLTRNEKVCPGCGTQWPYVVTKAEAVEEEEDDTEVHQQPPEPLRRKTSRGSRQVQEEGLNEPSSRRLKRSRNNEDQELAGQSQSQTSTQTLRKAKLEKITAVEVDNGGPGPSRRRATRTSTRLHR